MELVKEYINDGVLVVKNIPKEKISRQSVYDFIKENEMERIGPGIYLTAEALEDETYTMYLRCPNGVISHEDALYYYGLIDREPMEHCLTIYTGYNPTSLKKSGYKVYTIKKEFLDLGKTRVVNQFGHEIPMYDLERTICDLIRNRNNFEIQDLNTAMKTYVKKKNKNLNRLMEYAKKFRVDRVIQKNVGVLL